MTLQRNKECFLKGFGHFPFGFKIRPSFCRIILFLEVNLDEILVLKASSNFAA